MTDSELDAYVAAVSRALCLPLEEDWKASIRSNLATSLKFGHFVSDFRLPDESEPASVFEP
jgi:hypothetical protein